MHTHAYFDCEGSSVPDYCRSLSEFERNRAVTVRSNYLDLGPFFRTHGPVRVGIGGEDADGRVEVLDAGGDDVVEGGAPAGGRRDAVLEPVKHLRKDHFTNDIC